MSTLELLQLQNEHKDNFFGKGEDFIYESNETQEQEGQLTMEEKLLYLLEFFMAEADDLHFSSEDDRFYKEANKLFNRGDYDELVKLCLNKYK